MGDESAAPKPNPKGEVDLKDIKGIALASAYSECEFGIRLRDRVGRAPYELRAPSAELCQCVPASSFCARAGPGDAAAGRAKARGRGAFQLLQYRCPP